MSQKADPAEYERPESGPFNLLRPLLIMAYSLYFLPITILYLLISLDVSTLLNIEELKSAWFARFWAFFGPRAREAAAPAVMPLLRQNARGVCLDIGPGTGQWLYLFARAQNPDITKIYGVEPNPGLHAELRANAVRAGLGDVYEVIGCGAQELKTKGGIALGSVDTIITVQCLCSIPGPQSVIRDLFPLLKPGGTWLVFEHVKSKAHGEFVYYWQKGINYVWPHLIGGCDITRPTDEWLLQAGEWEEVKLKPLAGEGKYDTVPHVSGTLTKRR